MNRFLYTILIAAASVGITLAFVAGCSKKCVCDDKLTETTETGAGTTEDGGAAYTTDEDADASRNSSATTGSGNAAGTRQRSANGTDDAPPVKYGDAETGGNVYSVGGVEPAAGSPGSAGNKDTSKTPKAKLRPARTTGLKTAADGQRN